MRPLLARPALALALAAGSLLCAPRVSAHASGLSRGDYRRTATGVEVSLGFAPSDGDADQP